MWVYQRIGKTQEVFNPVNKSKREYFDPIMHNTKYELLQLLIMQGKVAGRNMPGRRRKSWLRNLDNGLGRQPLDYSET